MWNIFCSLRKLRKISFSAVSTLFFTYLIFFSTAFTKVTILVAVQWCLLGLIAVVIISVTVVVHLQGLWWQLLRWCSRTLSQCSEGKRATCSYPWGQLGLVECHRHLNQESDGGRKCLPKGSFASRCFPTFSKLLAVQIPPSCFFVVLSHLLTLPPGARGCRSLLCAVLT